MELPSIFKKPKYKRFEYRPRTYDARKRAIQLRQERRKKELQSNQMSAPSTPLDEERMRRTAYIKERFAGYRTNKIQPNNTLWLIIRTILCLGVFFFSFFGIGQLSINISNNQFIWNDHLSYALIIICVIYFTYRLERKKKN